MRRDPDTEDEPQDDEYDRHMSDDSVGPGVDTLEEWLDIVTNHRI